MTLKEHTKMYLTKSQKNKLLHLIVPALIVYLTLPSFASVNLTVGIDENYTYYGVVPAEIYRYILNDWNAGASNAWSNLSSGWILGPEGANLLGGSLAQNDFMLVTKSLLAIVASADDTNVEVYDLTTSIRISQGNLNDMGKLLVLLDNGTHFKVVSDKMVSVELLNYQQIPSANALEGPLPHTYYTSVNGLYVDKEFVLMASEQTGNTVSGQGTGTFYTILTVEKSTVTVTDDEGFSSSYSLDANSFKYIMLEPFKVYRIESTGGIMVQSGLIAGKGSVGNSCYPIPAAEGGFVGTFFVARSLKNQEWGWDPEKAYGFMILASQDTTVKLYDLETKQLIREVPVTGGIEVTIQPPYFAIALQSNNPITVCYTDSGNIEQGPTTGGGRYGGYGNGVMIITIQPAEDTMIHLPTDAHVEAYFFASETTQLMIDGNAQTVQANVGFLYTVPGTHTIQADHNVVVQINFWPLEPEYQGLWFSGAAIPCIETVNDNPTVTLTPIEGFPMMYVIVGAAIAAVAVIVGLMVMRRRGSKPS
jgi:hypothetical protein